MRERYLSLIRKLYGATVYYSGVTGLRHRSMTRGDQLQILAYHQIEALAFERHLRYLLKRHHIVPLFDLYLMLKGECSTPPHPVALTFDDGHLSFYRDVFPLLLEHRVPATVFLATDYVGTGRSYWFDRVEELIDRAEQDRVQVHDRTYRISSSDRYDVKEEIKAYLKDMAAEDREAAIEALAEQCDHKAGAVPEKARVIDWPQAVEMQRSGLVEIGGHTCSHPILSQIPAQAARQEIRGSKRILEERLETPVRFFAYPNGRLEDLTPETIGHVRGAGYLAALTLVEGSCRPGDDLFTLKRLSASGGFTHQALAAKMNGLWRARARL